MKNLRFDFLADKENNTLTIRREFAANRQLVWDCYTKEELLVQWFAPKPYTVESKGLQFTNGGTWHYAMVSLDGEKHWGWAEYYNIHPIDSYESKDAFCDENGRIQSDLPQSTWKVTFSDKGQNTLVEVIITYPSLEDLETVIKMGMEVGMTMTLDYLDTMLEQLTK